MKSKIMSILAFVIFLLPSLSFANTPEQVSKEMFVLLKHGQWNDVADLYHPEALKEFKSLSDYLINLPEPGATEAIKSFFGPNVSANTLKQLSDAEFFALYLQTVMGILSEKAPNLLDRMEILGSLEGPSSTAFVTTKMYVLVDGKEIGKTEVVSFKKHSGEWKILLSGDFKALISQLMIETNNSSNTSYPNSSVSFHDLNTKIISLRSVAEQGDAVAQRTLGDHYYRGKIVPQDYKEAKKWFHLAAGQGDALAQGALGTLYYDGKGVTQNYVEAAKWVTLSAKQGHATAQVLLARLYSEGNGVPIDYKEAAKWARLAAEQGHSLAQSMLASMYYDGQGVVKNYKTAVQWYQLAAEQGSASAQLHLAIMYESGLGVPQNFKEAVKWYQLAAEQGNAISQFQLASMYSAGIGVPKDDKKAIKWNRLAAVQGDAKAQFNLGVFYVNGSGVPQSYENAYAWWLVAAANGLEEGQKASEKIKGNLTPSQIENAQQLASQIWKQLEK